MSPTKRFVASASFLDTSDNSVFYSSKFRSHVCRISVSRASPHILPCARRTIQFSGGARENIALNFSTAG
jgi:hypothetical protein